MLQVIDLKTGEPLGPGDEGEVCVRSPMNMMKYDNNPRATADALRDGWLYTGTLYKHTIIFVPAERL
jgi:long-subunit acyl-CoA synthetase (AMP-forming)